MSEDDDGVVIDNGSAWIRAGPAGEDAPSVNFPSVIGRGRDASLSSRGDSYVGDAAQRRRDLLHLRFPIERGLVTNWDDMETIWRFLFDDALKRAPDQTKVLMSEPVFCPKLNRETTAQIMFESLGVPQFLLRNTGYLSYMSIGRTVALIVDVGEGVAYTMPFYEGHTILHAVRMQHTAGRDVTDLLTRQLRERDIHLTTASERVTATAMKESLAYVASDFEGEMRRSRIAPASVEKKFNLPGDETVSIGSERFVCAEGLFQPRLFGLGLPGIHDMVLSTMQAVEMDVRRDMWVNIFLCGGASRMPGYVERMRESIVQAAPAKATVRVLARPERHLFTWIGGSLEASLTLTKYCYVTKAMYEEYGPGIVDRFLYF